MVIDNKKTTTRIIFIVKLFLLVFILAFIYLKLADQQTTLEDWWGDWRNAALNNVLIITIIGLLMPVNWMLESKKWMYLAEPIEKLTLWQAIKGVLAGLSMAFITPHGIGAYLGRVLMIKNQQRGQLIGAILAGRMAQLIATCIFATAGIYFLFEGKVLAIYLLGLISFLAGIYFLLNLKVSIKNKRIRKIRSYLKLITNYNFKTWSYVGALSMLRYLVFCLQFVLALEIFSGSGFLLNFSGATWVLFAKSVLPTFNFLSDLGVREVSAIYFFEKFDVPIIPVLNASLFIWFLNILVPTLVGAPFILKLRFTNV